MQKRVGEILLLLVVLAIPGFAVRAVVNNQRGPQVRFQKLTSFRLARTQKLSTRTGKQLASTHITRPRRFASLSAHQLSLFTATQIPAGGSVPFPLMGDFNGDGKKDVASFVTTSNGVALSVLLGNGDGTFTQQPLISLDPSIDGFIVGDLNGDGKDDLVAANFNASGTTSQATFIPYLSNGDGTFTEGATYTVTSGSLAGIFLIDTNGDGNLDFIALDTAVTNSTTNVTTQNVWTLAGDGHGGFGSATSTPLAIPAGFSGLSADGTVIMDNFDGNYPAELVGADMVTGQLTVYLASSSGVYANPVFLATPDSAYNACFSASGDLTGDGKPEIVTANCAADTLTVYLNNGNGTFSTGVYFDAGTSFYPPNTLPADNIANTYPDAVAIADVNGDGIKDLVSTNALSGDITVLIGQGNGRFIPPTLGYATGQSANQFLNQQALVADLNGDGKADILVSDDDFSLVYLQGKGDGTFAAAPNYYSGSATALSLFGTGFVSGDFNGDGIPDFAVGNNDFSGADGITVFLSNPDGTMQTGMNYGTDGDYSSAVVGDFNGDGILDIAVTSSANGVVIFTGNPSATNPKVGDGTFTQSQVTFPTDTASNPSPSGIVAGDFNGDGKTDLAVVNTGTSDVGVLINNSSSGNVSFANVVNYGLIAAPAVLNLTAADVNGDGKLDLLIPANMSGQGVVIILPGVGDGTFSMGNGSQVLMPNIPYAVAVGDLNGDGIADLAVSLDNQTDGNGIAVALGTGNGSFGTATLFPSTLQAADSGPGALVISDVNGDGSPDLVFDNILFGSVGILYGSGNGTFSGLSEFPTSGSPIGLALADVNSDGNVDVVTGGEFSGVTVLLNTAAPVTQGQNPSITTLTSSLNPALAAQTVTFTATVTGPNGTPTGTVRFNDGTTLLGSASLNAGGVASFSTASLSVGTHSIVARYSGDPNFQASTSQALNQVINQAATPDYTLSSNPNSATIQRGSSATFTITLTPSNGYNGTVALACGSLPAGVTCSFSPSSLTPANNQPITSTLTIKTTAPSSASLSSPPVMRRGSSPSELFACMTGMGLFGFVVMEEKKRKRSRWALVLGIVVLVMMLGLVGCGSSANHNNNNGGNSGTPAGSYTVQLTASGTAGTNGGNTAAHSLNIVISVQ